jgi:hypothetical protein
LVIDIGLTGDQYSGSYTYDFADHGALMMMARMDDHTNLLKYRQVARVRTSMFAARLQLVVWFELDELSVCERRQRATARRQRRRRSRLGVRADDDSRV